MHVGPRHVGHRAQGAFPPQVVVVQRRDLVQVDGIDRHDRTAVAVPQRPRHHRPGRGERDRRVERHRQLLVVGARPGGTQLRRPGHLGHRPRHHVDLRPPVAGHLQGDRRRGAEAVQPQPQAAAFGPYLGHPQRAVADHPAAQQRCHGGVGRRGRQVGQGVRERSLRHHELGIAAVDVPAGELRVQAEVLPAGSAESALAAGAGQPDQPGAVTDVPVLNPRPQGIDHPDHLMARHHRQQVRGQVAGGQLQVGAADGAGRHPQPHLAGARDGQGALHRAQGLGGVRSGGEQFDGTHAAHRGTRAAMGASTRCGGGSAMGGPRWLTVRHDS